eukprot:4697768-Amphidinium_carterae.1
MLRMSRTTPIEVGAGESSQVIFALSNSAMIGMCEGPAKKPTEDDIWNHRMEYSMVLSLAELGREHVQLVRPEVPVQTRVFCRPTVLCPRSKPTPILWVAIWSRLA